MSVKPSIAKTSTDLGSALSTGKTTSARSASTTNAAGDAQDTEASEASFQNVLSQALAPKDKKANASKPAVLTAASAQPATTPTKATKLAGKDGSQVTDKSADGKETLESRADDATMQAALTLPLPVELPKDAADLGLNLLQLAQNTLTALAPEQETAPEGALEKTSSLEVPAKSLDLLSMTAPSKEGQALHSVKGFDLEPGETKVAPIKKHSDDDVPAATADNNVLTPAVALAAQAVWMPMTSAGPLPQMAMTLPLTPTKGDASKKEMSVASASTTEISQAPMTSAGLPLPAKVMDAAADFQLPTQPEKPMAEKAIDLTTAPETQLPSADIKLPGLPHEAMPATSAPHSQAALNAVIPQTSDATLTEQAPEMAIPMAQQASSPLQADTQAALLSSLMTNAAQMDNSTLQSVSIKETGKGHTKVETTAKSDSGNKTEKASTPDKATRKDASKTLNALGVTLEAVPTAHVNAEPVAATAQKTTDSSDFSQAMSQTLSAIGDSSASIQMTGPDNNKDAAQPTFLSNAATPGEQVMDGTIYAVKNGQRELIMRLNPDNLGEVKINLTSHASGGLSAKLIASSPESAALLSQQAESLQTSLEAKGVKVDKISVIIAGQGEFTSVAAASEANKSQSHNSSHHDQPDSQPQQQSNQQQSQNFQQQNQNQQMAQAFQQQMSQSQRQQNLYGQPQSTGSAQPQTIEDSTPAPEATPQRQAHSSGQVSVLA